MDRFVEDASLEENVESFLSHDDTDPRDVVGRCMDVSKGVVNDILLNDLFVWIFLTLWDSLSGAH